MHLRPGNLYGGFCLDNFYAPLEIATSIYPAQRTAAHHGVSLDTLPVITRDIQQARLTSHMGML
jgi:hypothetical protein